MPVEDLPIHSKVRHDKAPSGCYLSEPPVPEPLDPPPKMYRTFTGEVVLTDSVKGCCQIGRRFNGAWVPLDECLGCKAIKDEEYIDGARKRIDEETARFMKADQRI